MYDNYYPCMCRIYQFFDAGGTDHGWTGLQILQAGSAMISAAAIDKLLLNQKDTLYSFDSKAIYQWRRY